MKYLLTMICAMALLCACSDDDSHPAPDDEEPAMPSVGEEAERTVMVYMSAENNLSYYTTDDIAEMVTGSKELAGSTNLVAFVDKKSGSDIPPYVLRIKDGLKETDTELTFDDDFYASDPVRMRETLTRMMERYPARSYGLVLWGHAGGWLIEKDSVASGLTAAKAPPRLAYGVDTGADLADGDGNKWMNIPSLAKALEGLPHRLTFIFADCCNFQCVETAYELRHAADYIIGSPAETPACGAPYDKIVPYMFSTADDFYRGIVEEYNTMVVNYNERVPMSVIKTSEMEALATATRDILPLLAQAETLDTENIIYYRRAKNTVDGKYVKVMTDMNDLMLRNVADTEAYGKWKEALDRAVVCKAMSSRWLTDGWVSFDFAMTEERYGGVSMFVPQAVYDRIDSDYDYNNTIRQMQWYYAAEIGQLMTW